MIGKKINGFITIRNNEYSFCLDENNIYGNLLKESDGKRFGSFEKDVIPFIKAKFSLGGTIAFYNFSYSKDFFDCSLLAKSYGVFLSKSININVEGYDCISFKGKAVNNFYPPALSVERIDAIEYPNEDGSKTIKLKSFLEKSDEIDVKIDNQTIRIQLSVCTPGSIGIDSTNLGEIYTTFRVIFKEKMPLEDLLKWVLAIKKVFAFIYFRNDIAFDEIELLENTKLGFSKIGNLFLYEKFENDIPQKSSNCVKFLGVKEHFANLFPILLDKELNLLCLPKNKQDSWVVSPEKYIFTCAGFENVFIKKYPNYVNDDNDYLNIKERIISFLDNVDQEYKGKNANSRKWIKKIKDTIERESKNLDHKFNKCFLDYQDILNDFIEDIKSRYNRDDLDKMDLGGSFSSVRNHNAHGSKIEYNDESIIAFEFGRVMIYIMVLKLAEFTDEEIKNFIRILFIGI